MCHRTTCRTSYYTVSRKHRGEELYDLKFDEFLATTPKVQYKLDFTKIENFYSLKDTVKIIKR